MLSESLFARLEVLRGDKATRTMKQRALVDLFKALKTNGYSSMKWSIPSQMREMINILQLPIPDEEIFSSNFNSASLKEAESYFQRSTVELSRLQSEISLIGSQHMSQREMSLMLGFSEHGMLMLAQMRCMIQNLLRNLASIDKLLGAISEAGDSLPMHQDYLMRNITKFDSSYLSGLENMKQLQLLLTSAVRLVDRERSNKLRDIISVVDSCTNRLDSVYRPHVLTSFVSVERLTNVRKGREVLLSVRDHFESCARESLTLQLLPEGMFDSCLEEIDAALEVCLSAEASTTTPTTSIASNDLVSELDSLIEVALVGAQILTKGNEMSPKGSGESSSGSVEAGKQTTRGLWECHASTVNEWNRLNVAKFKPSDNLHDGQILELFAKRRLAEALWHSGRRKEAAKEFEDAALLGDRSSEQSDSATAEQIAMSLELLMERYYSASYLIDHASKAAEKVPMAMMATAGEVLSMVLKGYDAAALVSQSIYKLTEYPKFPLPFSEVKEEYDIIDRKDLLKAKESFQMWWRQRKLAKASSASIGLQPRPEISRLRREFVSRSRLPERAPTSRFTVSNDKRNVSSSKATARQSTSNGSKGFRTHRPRKVPTASASHSVVGTLGFIGDLGGRNVNSEDRYRKWGDDLLNLNRNDEGKLDLPFPCCAPAIPESMR